MLMKQLYTILLATAITAGHAQLTQANHAPAANDTYTMLGVDPTGITPGASGSGATWNFASAATVNSLVMNYTATTANSGSYPQANVVVGYSGSNMSYVKSSSSSLLYYGGNVQVQTVSGSLNYSAPAIWGVYPMSLNTSSVTSTAGNISTSVGNGTFAGSSTVTVDGSGDLILSTGMFSNVLRTKTSQTLDFNTGFLSGKLYQDTYEYYGTMKSPLFSIMSATISLGTQNYTQVMAQQNKEAVPSGTTGITTEKFPSMLVYPQPASQQLTISNLPQAASQVDLFDITGKLIASEKVTSDKVEIRVTEFQEGLYLYNVKDGKHNTLLTGKFTVVH
jgi:hypothetical protein